MADSKARGPLSVNPPNQISKDMAVSDGSIPLSPQWLLPKPGESKAGMAAEERHPSPYSGTNILSDVNFPLNSEEIQGLQKKKDVFRPSFLNMESGRRDRWRDEERDTHSSFGRDRWREEDKELVNIKKIDRWTDTAAGKHFEEARRPPSERWNDLPRETGYEQRRESKWSTRWGPDNKEVSKWNDSGKPVDNSNVKGLSHPVNHAKDEREGDQYRPWRSNFYQGRGKVELPNNSLPVGSKECHTFGYGRGRSIDNAHSTFMQGRGKLGYGANNVNHVSTDSRAIGFISDKDNNEYGNSTPFKYSRKNLLDLFRVIDTQLVHLLLDGFEQVPLLTLGEALEPLAFSPPISEELAIISGIEKGDIVSSGVPQISKEGSAGRGSTDTMNQRRIIPDVREGLTLPADESNTSAEWLRGANPNLVVGSPQEKQMHNHWSSSKLDPVDTAGKSADAKQQGEGPRVDGGSVGSFDDVLGNRDSNSNGKVLYQTGAAWHSSLGERTSALLHNQFDAATNTHAKSTDVGWLQLHRNPSLEREPGLCNSSMVQSELKWTTGEGPVIQQQVLGTIVREEESRKHSLIPQPPEDLILYYKDPQGAIQGPFSGSDIIDWFEAGYFDIDLPVRLANAPPDIPFSMLGDIMPHLKTKRAPPGFSVSNANEILDLSSMPATNDQGKVLMNPSGIDLIREGQRHPHGASTEAANKFLESLMANRSHPLDRFPFSEGHNTSGVRLLGPGGSDSFNLLAQRLALEGQRSLPSVYPQWPVVGTSPVLPNFQLLPDPSMSHPVVTEMSPQSSLPQNMDMMSILRGSPNRPLINTNDVAGGRSNFTAQGGLDQSRELHGPNFHPHTAFEFQQQRMAAQNHPSAPNLSGQRIDNPSSILTADKLLPSALPQDPQVVNLLQQQYLLQMRSQAPAPSQQLSLMDKIMLLKQQQQQQQQEEQLRQRQQQQQLEEQLRQRQQQQQQEEQLRQRQQQQQEEQLRQQHQLLSQVLTDQNRRHSDASYGQFHAVAASTDASGNGAAQLWHTLSPQMPEVGKKVPLSTLQGDGTLYSTGMRLYASRDVGSAAVSTTAMHLPHHSGAPQQMSSPKVTSSTELKTVPSLPVSVTVGVEQAKDDSGVSSSTEHLPPVNMRNEELTPTGTSPDSISNSVLRDNPDVSLEESLGLMNDEMPTSELAMEVTPLPATVIEEPIVGDEKNNKVLVNHEEPKPVVDREMKKSSEKKSRKQKSSKVQPPSNLSRSTAKSSSKASKQSEIDVTDQIFVDTGKVEKLSSILTKVDLESVDVKVESEVAVYAGNLDDALGSSAQKAWKAATNVKAKSLLEIQLEEQRRVKTEIAVSAITSPVRTASLSAPWAGVISISDPKSSSVVAEGCNNLGKSIHSVSNSSPGHDLSKANLKDLAASNTVSGISGLSSLSSQLGALDDDDFVDAKETKKSRKKGGKGKGAGNKSSSTISLIDALVSNSSVEKAKNSRQVQPVQEILPAPPQGPSLGDFVPWKPDLSSPSTAPAWSKDSAVLSKPTSMRDILKEQEKRGGPSQQHGSPLLTPQKFQVAQVNRVSSRSVSDISPGKAASPTLTSETLKHKGEDDLFWGPPDVSRQQTKLANVPQLGGNRGTKGTPAKIASSGVASTRQKSVVSSSATPTKSSSLKGKQYEGTKQSEAMDFRDWCERESIRLTGSRDTSVLEFCLKQPRSEAEILLVQNLGSLDTNHEFIGKFLDYMEMLPAEVLDIAFQLPRDQGITSLYGGAVQSTDHLSTGNSSAGAEAAVGKGGKKKGKKGKKVSPSVLGFSVVSNRIMMGEIQTVDD